MIPYQEFSEKTIDVVRKKDDIYSDEILTFDIEVSSGWINEHGKVIGYSPDYEVKYLNELTPVSLPYIWQFGFNDKIYFGRELKSFLTILDSLEKSIKHIIYIHNSGYEHQFLSNFLEPYKSVFARNSRKPLYFISELYPHIEFRCSWMLTQLSLEAWGKEIGLPKLNTLDYNIIRTPKTELTNLELDYCSRDIEVMYKGLIKYKDEYKHVHKIPLTQTGRVRKIIKNKLLKKKNWMWKAINMIPHDHIEYKRLYDSFWGAYVHANHTLAMRTIKNVSGFDFASSYPFVMCSEKFPMTPFFMKDYDTQKKEDYAFILKVKMNGVVCRTYNTYLSESKCIQKESLITGCDNGRVMEADYITLWCTDVDFEIIKKVYDITEITILESYASRKAYLPKEFIEYVLELYENKTILKNIKDKEDIYMTAKKLINSLYGMCATALVPDDVVYYNEGIIKNGRYVKWEKMIKSEKEIDDYLTDLRENPKGRTFLVYAWGVFIIAYSRRNLWDCILCLDNGNDKNDVIYCDTDSIKCRGKHDFKWYNDIADYKLKKMCDFYNIPFQKTRPLDSKGVSHPLGYFEKDGDYLEFKTLGSKRYCYRDRNDGKLHLTVSGVNKEAVSVLKNDINNFHENLVFSKDNNDVKPLLLIYTNEQPECIWKEGEEDEYKSNLKYGICSRPKGYELTIKDLYLTLCNLDNNSQGVFQ